MSSAVHVSKDCIFSLCQIEQYVEEQSLIDIERWKNVDRIFNPIFWLALLVALTEYCYWRSFGSLAIILFPVLAPRSSKLTFILKQIGVFHNPQTNYIAKLLLFSSEMDQNESITRTLITSIIDDALEDSIISYPVQSNLTNKSWEQLHLLPSEFIVNCI